MSDIFSIDIKYLSGVGPKRAEILKREAEICTYEDLLYTFPYKYVDRSKIYKISEIDGTMPYIQIDGRLTEFYEQGTGKAKRLCAGFTDGTGLIELIWFQGAKAIRRNYTLGVVYRVFGKPSLFGGKITVAHPEMEKSPQGVTPANALMGFYNTTEAMKRNYMSSKTVGKFIETLLQTIKSPLPETLTPQVIQRCNLASLTDALQNIHIPKSPPDLQRAIFRLKFEELFYIQLNILRYMKRRERNVNGYRFNRVGDYVNNFYHNCIPFDLTGAQKRVIKEMRSDMGSGRQMNRLLQGDVGSGKTLVAIMAMLIAADNGFQSCIMAPTEILATQHYESMQKYLLQIGINIALLTGSTKKSERTKITEGLTSGTLNIIVGTHALIEDYVEFKNLGLVVIDEQHRFGVGQRAKLWKKSVTPPHILVMSATPIPRTLSMTLYGDLDVSVIDELPPGRKPISTLLRYDSHSSAIYSFIHKEIEAGRQAYFVYPLIKESEKSDLKNIEEGFELMQRVFPQYNVCMVHGKMKPKEKDKQMQLFAANEAQIMVATTVIEVGVDVPNASVMVIENAERFGLSQLHQLRGRVGRGADQSYCILKTHYKLGSDSKRRLNIMCKTNDGFEIAEADLQLRGPGDIDGTQQSGVGFNLKIANITRDSQILQLARDVAFEVLDNDPELISPNNTILNTRLHRLFRKITNFGLIG